MNPTNSSRRGTVVGDVASILPRVPKYARLVWLLLKDPALNVRQRTALMAAVGYSVSPVDAIPGIIPVIGQLDDLAIVLLTVRWILGSLPPHRAQGYLAQSDLSRETLDADFHLVRRSGVRILKRAWSLIGIAAVFTWGVGRFAGREVLQSLHKRRKRDSADDRSEC